MPNWKKVLEEVKAAGSTYDTIRRKYLKKLTRVTGRNAIVYYSGWLQKPALQSVDYGINDSDKEAFMSVIYGLDRSKGLDLLLHTPGGNAAATESTVDYLRSMFGNDVRAIIPQIAMSAGTMTALSCKEIVMGKHSSLGPIDPQINGIPAHGIIEEFTRAGIEIAASPAKIHLWQPIIAKYHPTLIGECEKAITWSQKMVKEWLISGMFREDINAETKAQKIVDDLSDHALTLSHSRHISAKQAKEKHGINVSYLEDDDALQEAVLSVHHACIQTLADTSAVKIVENQNGIAYIQTVGEILRVNR
jgi:membrane-bound ClpP family serine protease